MDCQSNCLCPLDSFWMIMAAFCTFPSMFKDFFPFVKPHTDGTHSHGAPIAKRTVWLRIITMYPLCESAAIAPHWMWITVTPFVDILTIFVRAMKQGVCNSYCADSIICKAIFI